MTGVLSCFGLLATGPIDDRAMAVRDGIVNFYVLRSSGGLVCIDTGWRCASVLRGFERLRLNVHDVKAVFLTHLHWDHARCLRLFPGAKVFVGEREQASRLAKRLVHGRSLDTVKGGRIVTVGGLAVEAIESPGHTPGSMSYVVGGSLLFTGDTLWLRRGKVRPFPRWLNGDRKALHRSIRGLARLKGIDSVFTAHSGVSRDAGNAFSQWRESAGDVGSGGAGR